MKINFWKIVINQSHEGFLPITIKTVKSRISPELDGFRMTAAAPVLTDTNPASSRYFFIVLRSKPKWNTPSFESWNVPPSGSRSMMAMWPEGRITPAIVLRRDGTSLM